MAFADLLLHVNLGFRVESNTADDGQMLTIPQHGRTFPPALARWT
ncbi:hypothetical protein G9444_6540 (plasmid) [Rhodococcus erythropolis]|uniref:Uncharacterized protein n=1 Tax=Rhodococcus erythropolis TaxID=1833 RepID=A0A6G9D3C1_RHOER|nr:hypothetical protein G9444_6540 [Rhodococcus erythropolis]